MLKPIEIIMRDPSVMHFMNNPSTEEQLEAVRKDPYLIRYIENPPVEVQLAAVKKNEEAIKFIKNPCPEAQLLAYRKSPDPRILTSIKNPCLELQMMAVNRSWCNIQHIKNPHTEAQLIAVRAASRALLFIKKPSLSLYVEALKRCSEDRYYRDFSATVGFRHITYNVVVGNSEFLVPAVIESLLLLNKNSYTEEELTALQVLRDSLA